MEPNQDSVQFIERAPINESDREKIFQLNAEELLEL
jgi:predicted TIM-barrel fold metal-dependent hydrolase